MPFSPFNLLVCSWLHQRADSMSTGNRDPHLIPPFSGRTLGCLCPFRIDDEVGKGRVLDLIKMEVHTGRHQYL